MSMHSMESPALVVLECERQGARGGARERVSRPLEVLSRRVEVLRGELLVVMMMEKGGEGGLLWWTYLYRRRMCLTNGLLGQTTMRKRSQVGGK
jgi:hypothetical protein